MNKRILTTAVGLTLFGMVSRGQEKQELGPQVALIVDHMDGEDKIVVPKAFVVLRLYPASGVTSKAPLNRGDWMLCRQHDIRDQNGILHIAFQCGGDEYVLKSLGVRP